MLLLRNTRRTGVMRSAGDLASSIEAWLPMIVNLALKGCMTKNVATPGTEILEAALHGLEAERDKLEQQIAQVRALLGHKRIRVSKVAGTGVPGTKRVLSSDARQRIAAAQRKRWAAFRKKRK